jgi:hypothetical protein
MSLNDIYRVTTHYELPTSAGSWSVYYKETIDASGGDIGTQILAEAYSVAIAAETLDLLSQDCAQPAITCERVFGIPEAKYVVSHGTQVGTRPSDSLPSNCAAIVQMIQNTFLPKSNGRIFIPGIAENDTDSGVLSLSFLTNQITPFINKLVAVVAELSAGTGRFVPGVISAKVLNAAPPAKDWAGAFAPLTATAGSTILGIMRKRATKAIGRAV